MLGMCPLSIPYVSSESEVIDNYLVCLLFSDAITSDSVLECTLLCIPTPPTCYHFLVVGHSTPSPHLCQGNRPLNFAAIYGNSSTKDICPLSHQLATVAYQSVGRRSNVGWRVSRDPRTKSFQTRPESLAKPFQQHNLLGTHL